jgi:hypothetical protein
MERLTTLLLKEETVENTKLSDQFARKVAQFQGENLKPAKDADGFDILSPLVNGWVREEPKQQWICYRAGHAVCAITDEVLGQMSYDQFVKMNGYRGRGVPPLPKGLFGRAD